MGLQRPAQEGRKASHSSRDRPTHPPHGQRESKQGYDRIQGALANLGHKISDTTVGKLLRAHGIEPPPTPKRQTTWKTFLKVHWDVLGAIDFTTIEVWTGDGLVTFDLLFVMEVTTRRVRLGGCTMNPNEEWMKQIARNLTDSFDGFLLGPRYLLMDRDTKFCEAFRFIVHETSVEAVSCRQSRRI